MLLGILFCIIRFMQYTPGQGVRGSTDGEFCWRKAENLNASIVFKNIFRIYMFLCVCLGFYRRNCGYRDSFELIWEKYFPQFHIVKFEKFWCVCLWEFSELTNFVIVRLEIHIQRASQCWMFSSPIARFAKLCLALFPYFKGALKTLRVTTAFHCLTVSSNYGCLWFDNSSRNFTETDIKMHNICNSVA